MTGQEIPLNAHQSLPI